MPDEIKILTEQEIENVSGGGANGNFWSDGGAIYYRVVSGDTLSEIALRAQVPMGQIQALNGIKNPDVISVGQKLTIYPTIIR